MNIENSRNYYGEVLTGSSDLKTDACCTTEAPPPGTRAALANVHEEVRARYYGCGLVAPEAMDGLAVLDLGSGSGQDAYLLAQLVGSAGSVVGVDTTPEQLAVANRHRQWHADRFGFANVTFLEGDIERLEDLGLADGSFDVIVSNCVINLVADKAAVFKAAHRLLKQGGELYFSDIYSDRRVSPALRSDPVLHGECLAGALYWGDFQRLAEEAGFADPRLVSDRPLAITDPQIIAKVAGHRFFSATYRLFKLDGLEPQCEDYGQAIRYRGTIPEQPKSYRLDKHHLIDAGRMFPVCGNSWKMLAETRLAPHFEFFGNFERHFGVFQGCGAAMPYSTTNANTDMPGGGSCC